MKVIKAVLLGILLWVLIFLEVSFLTSGLGLGRSDMLYNSIHFILLVLFILFVNLIYFRKKIKPNFVRGLSFGVVLVIVGVILDSIIAIPLFLNSDYNFLFTPDVLFGNFLIIIVSAVFSYLVKK